MVKEYLEIIAMYDPDAARQAERVLEMKRQSGDPAAIADWEEKIEYAARSCREVGRTWMGARARNELFALGIREGLDE